MKRLLPLILALLCLAQAAFGQAVNTLSISNRPPDTNFVAFVMGNRLLRVPMSNVLDVIKRPHSGFIDLTVTNDLYIGTNGVWSFREDAGLFYLWNETEGTAPIAVDESTGLFSVTAGITSGGTVTAVSLTSGTSLVTGAGFVDGLVEPFSQLTNYVVTAGNAERTLNMTNSVHFYDVSGESSGTKYFPCVTLTNFSGSAQALSFNGAWNCYGTATNSIASGKTARVCFEVEGNNVRYSVAVEGEQAASDSALVYRNNSSLDITNTTGTTNVLEFTIPGGELGTNKSVRFVVAGYLLNNSGTSKSLSMTITLGATTLFSSGTASAGTATTNVFRFEGELVNNNSASAQSLSGTVQMTDTSVATIGLGKMNADEILANSPVFASATEDTTSAKTLTITLALSATGDVVFRKLVSYAVVE